MKSTTKHYGNTGHTVILFEALYQSSIPRKDQLLMGVSETFPDDTLSQNETSEMPSQNMLGNLEESLSFCPHTLLTLI